MKNVLLLIIALIAISCSNDISQISYETKEYNVYMQGKVAGTHSSMKNEQGAYIFTFQYSDRGRGPEIHEEVKLNKHHTISSLEINGLNYLKDEVSETFVIKDNSATWKSKSESGNQKTDGNSFYASVNGTIGDTELLIRKLLITEEKSIQLIPSGQVLINKSIPHTIEGRDLRLIELSGMGFIPSFYWLDQDDRIFAAVTSWISVIEEKNAHLLETLMDIQTELENDFFENLSKDLSTEVKTKIAITNTNVFDANTGKIIPNQTVVLNGNRIETLLESNEEVPAEYHNIDGSGKTVLPGLFDNHCHVQKQDGILHIAAGVTAIRDMANSSELLKISEDFDENHNIGPRIVTMAGFIDQKGPYAGPGLTISNVEEGIEAIQNYKEKGYQQIKLYSSIDPTWVKPLAETAHELDMKLSGHIPAHMLAEDAIKDGFDEIQHINMIVLNFLSDTIDTRTPLRFSAVAEHAHKLDLKGEQFKKFVQLLLEKDIEIDATVSIFEAMFTTKAGEPNPQFSTILDRLPIQVKRGYYSGGLPIPDGMEDEYKASFQKLLDIILELHTQGVTIIPGTDAMPGFSLHKELENYVKAGISASEVLQMATKTSAEICMRIKDLGTIEPGKLADLILIDGNPVENISDIRRVVLTIKDGRIYDPKQLYASLGIGFFEY